MCCTRKACALMCASHLCLERSVFAIERAARWAEDIVVRKREPLKPLPRAQYKCHARTLRQANPHGLAPIKRCTGRTKAHPLSCMAHLAWSISRARPLIAATSG